MSDIKYWDYGSIFFVFLKMVMFIDALKWLFCSVISCDSLKDKAEIFHRNSRYAPMACGNKSNYFDVKQFGNSDSCFARSFDVLSLTLYLGDYVEPLRTCRLTKLFYFIILSMVPLLSSQKYAIFIISNISPTWKSSRHHNSSSNQ